MEEHMNGVMVEEHDIVDNNQMRMENKVSYRDKLLQVGNSNDDMLDPGEIIRAVKEELMPDLEEE
ncbi:AcrB/AcrD/AcrF family protein [Sesbania bispinosa]|nr:AcrB/AcrD/AcrF family protein [Sesbania bispinosa]